MPIAESFAVLVGLLSQFKASGDARKQSDFNAFMDWLIKTNHQDVIDLLEKNTATTTYIKSILNQDREWLREKLERIDSVLTAYAGTLEGFSDLAYSVNPQSALSEQALSILKQIDKSGAYTIIEDVTLAGRSYVFSEKHGAVEISDDRFARDDFETLASFGLLRKDTNKNGANLYIYTREASNLVKKLS